MDHQDRVAPDPGEKPNRGHSVYVEKPWNVEMLGALIEIGEGDTASQYKIVGIENNMTPDVHRLIVLPTVRCGPGEFLPERPKGSEL